MTTTDNPAAATVAAAADAHSPPGAVFAITEGEQTHYWTSGTADLETAEAMTQAHAHDLASVSKLLTTLTLQRLFTLGELAPQDTLARFFGPVAGAHCEVTVEDLLRHQSGFREWWPMYLSPGRQSSPIPQILEMPARYPRGVEWHYSDLGMQVAGAVAAEVTAQSFSQAVGELLLGPLGIETITPGRPHAGTPVTSGPLGDAIEREMVASNTPYPVDDSTKTAAADFPWREHQLRGEVADCNAFHAFDAASGQAAGHAGWFGDAAGLLRLGAALAVPENAGISAEQSAQLATAAPNSPDFGEVGFAQGRGARMYQLPWRGEQRTFLAHPGFTGTYLAAAPATPEAPKVISVMLSNRLHGQPPPDRDRLMPVDQMWRRAMASANKTLHQAETGDAQ
ncbi:serine hydrolase domain-containing protein [Nesterenkonia ebinurensis]|uniref:serine hydrolase domain-containing protein n=1 Tax=Nesterenkonia ebinurensis TaxID=2608252 RepID=UPI00123D0ACB|nr:serine hydrolase domain-containing protein [Nesterenkonia ebinurensis]